MSSNPNMSLWESWPKVPAERVRAYTTHDGAKLHTVDPHYMTLMATEKWGPIGDMWGLKDLKIEGFNGHLVGTAVFFYPCSDHDTEIPVASSLPVTTDAAKRLVTDMLKKALSMVGMASEVYLGDFGDDPQSAGKPSTAPPAPAPANAHAGHVNGDSAKAADAALDQLVKKAAVAIRKSKNEAEVSNHSQKISQYNFNDKQLAILSAAVQETMAALSKQR